MPEVALRLVGSNVTALRSVRELVAGLQDVRIEEGRVAETAKASAPTIAEAARANVAAAVKQRESLSLLIAEYQAVAAEAGASAEEQAQATRLVTEAQAQLRAGAAVTAASIREDAALAVEAEVLHRDEVRLVMAEYEKLATVAGASAEQIVVANELAARSAAQIGLAAKASAAETAGAGALATEGGALRGFGSRSLGLSGFAGPAFIAGAAAGIIVKKAVDEATRAQESQVQLQNALHNSGIAWDDNAKAIERYLKKAEARSAFDKIDLRTSLGLLVRATGNVQKAQDLLNTATDVARGRGISLEAAVKLTTRAYQGAVGSLARMGIHITAVTTAQDKLREAHVKVTPEMARQAKEIDRQATSVKALGILNERYGGAAERHASTLAGHEEALANALTDVSVSIGKAVTPALSEMFRWITKEVRALQENKSVIEGLHATFKLIGALIRYGIVPSIVMLVKTWEYLFFAIGKVVQITNDDLVPAFKHFFDYIKRTGNAAWSAVVETAKAAVYTILQMATAGIRGILEVASHLPFVGDKARAALNSIDDYLRHWKPDFGNVVKAFAKGGDDAGAAFQAALNPHLGVVQVGKGPQPGAAGRAGGGSGIVGGSTHGATGPITAGLGALEAALGGHVNDDYATSGHASGSYHYKGEAADLAPDPRVWAILYSHKHAFAELFGPTRLRGGGLYHNGVEFYDAALQREHQNHIHVAYTGGPKAIDRMLSGGGGGRGVDPQMPSIGSIIASGKPLPGPAAPAYKGPSGDALLPGGLLKLQGRYASRAAHDIAAAQAATGEEAIGFYADAARELRREGGVLHREIQSLKAKLKGAVGGRRKAIEAEIAKVDGEVKSVHGAVVSALQSEKAAIQSQVSTLASNVSSSWGTVQQGIIAAFDETTQSMIDAVGKQFFQGAQTPQELAYAAMQAADQTKGLADALAAAKASGDTVQIEQAQHAIDLQKAADAATASRTKADAAYAEATAALAKKRREEEEHLIVDLQHFSDGLANGTENMGDLPPILHAYGVELGSIAKGSFIFKTALDDLRGSVKDLDEALQDLADLVSAITGKKHPRHHRGTKASGSASGGNGSGGGDGTGVSGTPPPAFAGGGIVPGPMIGAEDTISARVSTGEGILSRDEMRLLFHAAINGPARSAAASPLAGRPIYVLGATTQQVGMALARIVSPAQRRQVGFENY